MASPRAEVKLSVLETAVADAFSAVLASAAVFPLDTVKTRIQASNQKHYDHHDLHQSPTANSPPKRLSFGDGRMASWLRKHVPLLYGVLIHLAHGQFACLFKGFTATMASTFFMQLCYFYWYTLLRTQYIRQLLGRSQRTQLSMLTELGLITVAGALAQLFILPMHLIATRQQLALFHSIQDKPEAPLPNGTPSLHTDTVTNESSASDEKFPDQQDPNSPDHSFLGIAQQIYRDHGLTGFYSSLKPTMILCLNPGLTYGLFARMKHAVLNMSGQTHPTPVQTFCLGAASKTVATVVTFPLILAKVRLQAHGASPSGRSPTSLRAIVAHLVSGPNGIREAYHGLDSHIHKTVLSQALLFLAKDYFETAAVTILMAVQARRLRRAAT